MSDFDKALEAEIPRLRRYARALTRDVARADDLVQDCLTRAMHKHHLWQAGTDLRAWLFTILHNQHVNGVRRAVREGISVQVDEMSSRFAVKPDAGDRLRLRDLEAALKKLPREQSQVILLVGFEGLRYEEVAMILHVPVGTVRSRLSRGRDSLRLLMQENDDASEPSERALVNWQLRREAEDAAARARRSVRVVERIDVPAKPVFQIVNGRRPASPLSGHAKPATARPADDLSAAIDRTLEQVKPEPPVLEAVALGGLQDWGVNGHTARITAESLPQDRDSAQLDSRLAADPPGRKIVTRREAIVAGKRHRISAFFYGS